MSDHREKVKQIRQSEFTPSYLNNGAFGNINRTIGLLLDDDNFTDSYLTEDFKNAVRDYVSNKRLFLFLNDFENKEDRQLGISEWINRQFTERNPFINKEKSEILLRTFFGEERYVNYVTWDTQDNIIVHKVEQYQNSVIYDALVGRINDAIKTKNYSGLFTDSFLSRIVEGGYTYEQFKRQVSNSISAGILNQTLSVSISISNDFLGFEGGDGPLKLVEDGDGYRLNKEFSEAGVLNSTKIPSDKIQKFKEVTKWEHREAMFKIPPAGENSPSFFDKESIEKFANALKGRDLEQNEFKYYTGEIYDEWGAVFDAQYWAEVADVYSETLASVGSFVWNTISDSIYSVGSSIGIVAAQSTWAISSAFSTMIGEAIGASFASLASTGVAGSTVATTASGAAATGAAATTTTAVTTTGVFSSYYALLKAAGGQILNLAKSPAIWGVLGGVAVLGSLGYALFTADEESHEDKLKKTLVKQYMKFLSSAIVDLSSGSSAVGIGRKFREIAKEEEFLRQTLSIFAIDKEVERRVRLFSRFAFELKKDENFLDNDGAVKAAIQQSNANAFADIELPEITELTDEEISDRQRFYKQCALMMNMHNFVEKYEELVVDRQKKEGFIKDLGPNETNPYGGRFLRAKSKNKEQLLTNLFSSKDSQYFFEVPTHIVTQLTPKMRLYKVYNSEEGDLKRTEFIFPTHTDLTRKKNFNKTQTQTAEVSTQAIVPSFFDATFDKGDGVGLKSFNLEFNGTNPAEARNDVKGSMTLFFQSFADFVRERVSPNGDKFRFVDLIIHPKPDKDGTVQGSSIISKRQYEPSFYRIMVEIGYSISDFQGIGSSDKAKLMNAIKNTNKSYYLTMVDHDFSIKNDGTVEVNLTYRAYIESALKTLKFDALTTPELAEKRMENQTKLAEIARKNVCTVDELRDIKILLSAIEDEVLKDSLNSIMRRLYSRKKIFNCNIDNNHRKFFLNNGYYQKCDITSGVSLDQTDGQNSGDLGIVLNTQLPENSADYNFADGDENDTIVQFFFFGDLLHTILDTLYDPRLQGQVSRGMENTKIVLGSFDFETFHRSSETANKEFNISQIPISVEFFSRWFVDNVLNQRSTRKSFPILNFIRNLSNSLISNSLLEICVNRDIESRLIFQTSQMSAYREGGELLNLLTEPLPEASIVDTDKYRTSGVLPLEGGPMGDSKMDNFHHYIILNANGSTRSHDGTGQYSNDTNAGVYHIEIGSNRGFVKNVNFSKTDQQYLREARFMRRGIDGLMQLGSVYNVDIEMYGNSIFYPGMDIWLNPFGFGGEALGKPQTGTQNSGKRSLANILGIGGYHTITNVSLNLTPSSFSTNIKAMYYYSGDGEISSLTPASQQTDGTDEDFIEMGVNEQEEQQAAACKAEIVTLQNFRDNTGQNITQNIEGREEDGSDD